MKPTMKPITKMTKNKIQIGFSLNVEKCTAFIIGLKKPIDIKSNVADNPGIIWVAAINIPVKKAKIWI